MTILLSDLNSVVFPKVLKF